MRGYANLSLMSTHYWNSASLAFLARSLLYGEKMEKIDADQNLVNAHRAYSMAVFGHHQMALEQLRQMKLEKDADSTLPSWLQLVRHTASTISKALRSCRRARGTQRIGGMASFSHRR